MRTLIGALALLLLHFRNRRGQGVRRDLRLRCRSTASKSKPTADQLADTASGKPFVQQRRSRQEFLKTRGQHQEGRGDLRQAP